jgi:hypothetical protein
MPRRYFAQWYVTVGGTAAFKDTAYSLGSLTPGDSGICIVSLQQWFFPSIIPEECYADR